MTLKPWPSDSPSPSEKKQTTGLAYCVFSPYSTAKIPVTIPALNQHEYALPAGAMPRANSTERGRVNTKTKNTYPFGEMLILLNLTNNHIITRTSVEYENEPGGKTNKSNNPNSKAFAPWLIASSTGIACIGGVEMPFKSFCFLNQF